MPWYKFRYPFPPAELAKKNPLELLEIIIKIFNLGGFRFNPSKKRPAIQKFMDRYPYLVEEIEE